MSFVHFEKEPAPIFLVVTIAAPRYPVLRHCSNIKRLVSSIKQNFEAVPSFGASSWRDERPTPLLFEVRNGRSFRKRHRRQYQPKVLFVIMLKGS